jgi:hypothetical protein
MPLPEDVAAQLIADIANEADRPPHDAPLPRLRSL